MTNDSASTGIHKRPQASVWRLAGRQVWRDFIAGELKLLLWAVVLAVGALSAVGLFADRMRSGLERDAAQLLGGDAVVLGDKPLAPAFTQAAVERGLVVGQAANFPSMARAGAAQGGAARLAAVKAVDAAYPLRGTIDVRFGEAAPVSSLKHGPAPGTVWIDPPLANALGLKVGDGLELGDTTLRIAGLIAVEPDRGAGFAALAPRAMLNLADLPATGLVQPSSRVTWRLAVAASVGNDKAAAEFADWARARIKSDGVRGVRVENLASGRPEMTQTVDRAQQFLSLVALLTALLSAVAVAVAARDLRAAPPGRLRDAARAGPDAESHRGRARHRVLRAGPRREPDRPGAGLRDPPRLRRAAQRLAAQRPALAGPDAGAAGRRRRPHVAPGLRPAAGAAAGARAPAARAARATSARPRSPAWACWAARSWASRC